MNPTHIVPGSCGPWVLKHALEATKQPDEILVFPDDLSFGPIAGDIAKTRAAVRTVFRDQAARNDKIEVFWARLEQDNGPITIWFGRHSAEEVAMLLALCDRLGARDISVVDVTNLSIHASWNGASPVIPPPHRLQDVPGSVLRRLVTKPVPLEPAQREAYAARWRQLQAENALLRVIRDDALQSTEPDEFDWCLIEALSHDWRHTAWVIRAAERFAGRQYRQIGMSALLERAASLVEQGTLEAQGNVWELWDDDNESALRLPARYPISAKKADVCHVASHPSFAGNLVGCLHKAGKNDDVLGFPDDLSAGPIASDDAQVRAEWWDNIADWPYYDAISAFWRDLAAGPPLVVWFGRSYARDQCLYLALSDRLPDRIVGIGDVSTISVQYEWVDGTTIDIPPPKNVHGVPGDVLSSLTSLTVRPDPVEIAANAQRWRELKAENAPFRVVSDGALVSKPATYFDNIILEAAASEWRRTIRVIADALGDVRDAFHFVNDQVLLSRLVTLVESGALEADGDPWIMDESRIRRAFTG